MKKTNIIKACICIFFSTIALQLLAAGFSVVDGIMTPAQRKDMIPYLVSFNDQGVDRSKTRQINDKTSKQYGGILNGDSIATPGGAAHYIKDLICSYVSPTSKYYKSKELLSSMTNATRFLLSIQHKDGTIDLISTNFHSTPDTGFAIEPLALAYSIMLQNKDLSYGELPALVKQFLLNAGEALSVGGIHTPNHRWVVSSALSWINKFFPNKKYTDRIKQWYDEGIDLDPDGQFNERSTSVYSPVTDRMLIHTARNLGQEAIYEYARKNLDMSFYFLRSNGEIATESSRRQDQYETSNMVPYYFSYRYMSLHDKDSRYSGMVDYIERTVPGKQLLEMLPYFIENKTLLAELPQPKPIPTEYTKHFAYSDMVRIRKAERDMSIITDNPTILAYFNGNAALEAMRLSAAFFGKGQFKAQKMEKVGETYMLTAKLDGPYWQPIPKDKLPTQDGDWEKMPKSMRAQSEVQTMNTTVAITEKDGKATVKVTVDGTINVPVSLELTFRNGGRLSNANNKKGFPDSYLIKNGEWAEYSKDGDVIKVGPGVCKHQWTQLRGALPKMKGQSLYFTDFTPCVFEFTIE